VTAGAQETAPEGPQAGATPFHHLNDYLAIPRVTGLRLAPDGSWLAATVQSLSPDKKKHVTSIWRIDTAGGPPRKLTRSAKGEGNPRFLPDGTLLFTSERPDPDHANGPGNGQGDGDETSLWLLPAGGGEAMLAASLPGGVAGIETAAKAPAVIVTAPALPGASTEDERRRQARKDAGVTAILHETLPVRFWDHDLGPDDLRIFAAAVPVEGNPAEGDGGEAGRSADGANAGGSSVEGRGNAPRDLTPDAGRALIEQAVALSPDGRMAATGWWRWRDGVQAYSELVTIDVATGSRTVVTGAAGGTGIGGNPAFDYSRPVFSPDGDRIVCVRGAHDTTETPGDSTLVLFPGGTDLLPGFDRWPGEPVWDAAGEVIYFTADDAGRRPVFAVEVATGEVSHRTTDDAHYTNLSAAPDGTALYALRDSITEPPAPVRIDLASGEVTRLTAPGVVPRVPGRVTEVTATADDGHPLRGWLVLPDGATASRPAPLLLWVHGGPMLSWNGWQWRWNPWLAAAEGYAVLLPDPALSTGYGLGFIARGYQAWGPRPFADIMAITDAVVARGDIDEARTAMMGGSYGGYMANWVAGHTGRFRAIVSHAGLWALDQMFATTDAPQLWQREFGRPVPGAAKYLENSPHLHLDHITTPMLVIHGDRDFRVPVGEALRLWSDLKLRGKDARFLYFPDENHWILKPGNIRAWYQTVFAFLAQHVLGGQWEQPDLL
jgi:dipeptidyl aminopeptidase/acylaminoacyl peptidase